MAERASTSVGCVSEDSMSVDSADYEASRSRVKVVTALLKSGIPLSKLDNLRELLEENSYSLSSSTNLIQLVPFVHAGEMSKLKSEISGKHISVCFDGTTHVAEAFVTVIRYVDDDWTFKQRVARLMLLAKSLFGEEVARLLIETISTELGIQSHLVVAAMHDRASVNNVAVRTLKILYTRLLDVGCFSHTLDRVGLALALALTPTPDSFVKAWISMFSHSPKTRLLWKTQTGLTPKSYSATRWWSKFEVIRMIHDTFGDVCSFLKHPELPDATSKKLKDIVEDPGKCRRLKVELAVTVDAMEPFVRATYTLEGDSPLALIAYREISKLKSSVSCEHYPNINAIARYESKGNASHEQQLISLAKVCVQPAHDYFKQKFDMDSGELKDTLAVFKAARFFSPTQLDELKPRTEDIQSLKMFPFVDKDMISEMQKELPTYLSIAEGVSPDVQLTAWWHNHEPDLPIWARVCKQILLVQPSSASAERVFSLLQNSFSSRQECSLEDYITTSVILQYNSD